MSNTLEKLSQYGTSADVLAGQQIRINPLLRDARGNVLLPLVIKLLPSWAFQLMAVTTFGADAGTFVVQNVSDETRSLTWYAEFPHSIQFDGFQSAITAFTPLGTSENITWQQNDPCFLTPLVKDVDPTVLDDADIACSMITVDSALAPIGVSLPVITAANNGIIARIKRRGANPVTITPNVADVGALIDDQLSYPLVVDQEAVSLIAILADPITGLPCWRAF